MRGYNLPVSLGRHPQRNIVLTGFYAAGKTAAARELSRRMRRPYIDLEHELQRRSRTGLRVLLPSGAGVDEDVERHLLADCSYRRETIFELSVDTVGRGDYFRELHDFSFIVFIDPPFEELLRRMRSERRYAELLQARDEDALRWQWSSMRDNFERCDFQLFNVHSPPHAAGLILHSFFT